MNNIHRWILCMISQCVIFTRKVGDHALYNVGKYTWLNWLQKDVKYVFTQSERCSFLSLLGVNLRGVDEVQSLSSDYIQIFIILDRELIKSNNNQVIFISCQHLSMLSAMVSQHGQEWSAYNMYNSQLHGKKF